MCYGPVAQLFYNLASKCVWLCRWHNCTGILQEHAIELLIYLPVSCFASQLGSRICRTHNNIKAHPVTLCWYYDSGAIIFWVHSQSTSIWRPDKSYFKTFLTVEENTSTPASHKCSVQHTACDRQSSIKICPACLSCDPNGKEWKGSLPQYFCLKLRKTCLFLLQVLPQQL